MTHDLTIARWGLARDALAGQVAVITGAGRGIGRETARALAYLGATMVVAEIDPQTGQDTCSLVAALGGRALFQPTEVADESSVAALASRTLCECGRVDVLINNAILCPVASLVEMDAALWDRVIAVNLRGTFLTCKAFLPAMLAQGRGTIVNMTSTGAMPHLSAYVASKRGIVGLSQSLAAEVGERGVRVIAFAPGFVDTPALREQARLLAPHLGLSQAQFLQLSLHPAYDGPMPAADAGAATAYLVARLAGEYHGEETDGYAVLERAGYLQTPTMTPQARDAAPALSTPGPDLGQALDLARELAEIVTQIGSEFDRLPVFVRPMARSGFRSRAGLGIREWLRTAQELQARLERVRAGDRAASAELQRDQARLLRLLQQLAAYLQGVPAEAARFTKDEEFLRQVRTTTAQRVAVVQALASALHDLAPA